MATRMMGLEREYAIAVLGRNGPGRPTDTAPQQLLALAPDAMATLGAFRGNGVFLGNGGRLYVDSGNHLEYCTPETDNPWDAVRYEQAGDVILHRLLEKQKKLAGNGAEIIAFKCNVDYTGAGTTWAAHENFAHCADRRILPSQLIPHLVSRIIYTGSGGLNPFAPGIEFCLSPRATHLEKVLSGQSTSERGIYHQKDESLAGGAWQRAHLLCGDSLASHRACWLRAGTTCLVIALIEADLRPGDGMQLQEPLEAMRAFNADPTGAATAAGRDGERLTALRIQWHYLVTAEANLHSPVMPPWAAEVCQEWRRVLLELEKAGPDLTHLGLDWTIKLPIYRQHALQRGFSEEALALLNRKLRELLGPECVASSGHPFRPEQFLLGQGGPPGFPERLEHWLQTEGLSRAQLQALLKLRQELCELEVRFGQIGPRGIFNSLDRAGVVAHQVSSITGSAIEEAATRPPPSGRAKARGEFVHAHAGQAACKADWETLFDGPGGRVQRLSDPTREDGAGWEKLPSDSPDISDGGDPFADVFLEYRQGLFSQARRRLRLMRLAGADSVDAERYHCALCGVETRAGDFPAGLAALERLPANRPPSLVVVNQHLFVRRLGGLGPNMPEFEAWIRTGEQVLAQSHFADPVTVFIFGHNRAFLLVRSGRLREARVLLRTLAHDAGRRRQQPHLVARVLADLGEACRGLGQVEEARQALQEAEAMQRVGGFRADMLDYTLPSLARLEGPGPQSALWLDQAHGVAQEVQHHMGMVRVLVFQARLRAGIELNPQRRQRLLALRDQLPGLRRCAFLDRILDHWEDWTNGPSPADDPDPYWGL